MIKPCLSKMINNHKTQNESKIQLVLEIIFISSKDFKETRPMYTRSNNIDIMIDYETYQIIEELFKSLLQKYQKGLEQKMRGSKFIFDSVDLLHYELSKISLNRGGLYINPPDLLINKKATINEIMMTNVIYMF